MFAGLSLTQWLIWLALSILLAIISRRALGNPRCHGFYRYFAFIGASLVAVIALPYWHHQLFAPRQIASWLILFVALAFLVQAFVLLVQKGGRRTKGERENFAFENTERLIEEGIFRYIRHPMYGALILFSWGAWLKHPVVASSVGALIATVFLWLTAKAEERENLSFFGESYRAYMTRSKNFIPFLW